MVHLFGGPVQFFLLRNELFFQRDKACFEIYISFGLSSFLLMQAVQ